MIIVKAGRKEIDLKKLIDLRLLAQATMALKMHHISIPAINVFI